MKNDVNIKKEKDVFYNLQGEKKRIVLSEELGLKLIKIVHHEFGHIGSKTMYDMISAYYQIPNLTKMIKRFCENCFVCIRNKSRKKRPIGLLNKWMEPDAPFQMMSIDTIGGFSRNNNSPMKYLHVLIDHFTKYCWSIVSKTQKPNDFIELLDQVTTENQVNTLLCDQYPSLKSKIFKDYLTLKKIKCLYTPVNHSSSNGSVERVGQTLVNRIRCKFYGNVNQNLWPSMVKECISDYNRTCHSVTKFPPIYLLKGELNRLCPIELNEHKLDEDRKQAKRNTEEYFKRNKQYIDKNRREERVEIGDWVMVESKNKLNRSKLEPIRNGPYKVVEKVSPLLIKVEVCQNRMAIYHLNQIVRVSL